MLVMTQPQLSSAGGTGHPQVLLGQQLGRPSQLPTGEGRRTTSFRKYLRKLRHSERGLSAFPKVTQLGGGGARQDSNGGLSEPREGAPSRRAASCPALLLFLLFLLPPRGNRQASGGHPFLSASSFPHSGARAPGSGPRHPPCGSLCLSQPQFPYLEGRCNASANLIRQ